MKHEQALRDAIKRLQRSDTRIKRRNARRHLRTVLRRIQRDLMGSFPVIRKDGQAAEPTKKRPVCPMCGIPCRNWTLLARHLIAMHDCYHLRFRAQCWCGRTFPHTGSRTAEMRFGLHLAHVKNLKEHLLVGKLKEVKL